MLDFPNTPTVGQLYPSPAIAGVPVYSWDGTAWSSLGPPNTNIAVARSSIYAAPFDALAYNGMQVNGSCDVSQANGANAISMAALSGLTQLIDSWACNNSFSTAVLSAQQATPLGSPSFGLAYQNCLQVTATTGQATLSGTDNAHINHRLEHGRSIRLGMGNSAAQPLSIGFWLLATIAGTVSVALRGSSGQQRSYVTTVNINNPLTWEYKTITIPGDVSGTWIQPQNVIDFILSFGLGSASGAATSTLNQWQTGNFAQANTQTNFVATSGNVFCITGLIMVPGTELPNASRAPFIMRPYDQELQICKRYWELISPGVMQLAAAASGTFNIPFKVTKRAAPTMTTIGAPAYTNASGATINSSNIDVVILQFAASAAGGYVAGWTVSADARL